MADEEKKLALDNQHFSKFATATLTSLYEDKDFTDVTLVWENAFFHPLVSFLVFFTSLYEDNDFTDVTLVKETLFSISILFASF